MLRLPPLLLRFCGVLHLDEISALHARLRSPAPSSSTPSPAVSFSTAAEFIKKPTGEAKRVMVISGEVIDEDYLMKQFERANSKKREREESAWE